MLILTRRSRMKDCVYDRDNTKQAKVPLTVVSQKNEKKKMKGEGVARNLLDRIQKKNYSGKNDMIDDNNVINSH